MKHVIVIETPDEFTDKTFVFNAKQFEKLITETVELISDHFTNDACVVHTRFNISSAIDAVLGLYSVTREDIGKEYMREHLI